MRVLNVHSRLLAAPPERVGELIDSLGGEGDRLWPRGRWPAMRLDGPLPAASGGGHGPIRYRVEAYEPGRRVVFRFTRPAGFDGTHAFEVEPDEAGGGTVLRHVLRMRTRGTARLSWPLVFRPLHDALIEDALDGAEREVGGRPRPAVWSARVRLLRRILRGRR